MTQYVVIHAFQDKFTKKYYGVGSIYEATDENRAFDLENRGYITPDNTEAANIAKASAQSDPSTSPELKSAHQQIQKDAEAKTIVNGKIVSVKDVQTAQQALEAKTNQQTGIQEHHTNSTEAVAAGQVAKNQAQTQAQMQAQQAMTQAQQQMTVANMQSGQQALEKELQSAQASSPNEASSAKAYTQAMQSESMGAYTSQESSQQAQAANAAAEAESKAVAKAKANAKAKGNQ